MSGQTAAPRPAPNLQQQTDFFQNFDANGFKSLSPSQQKIELEYHIAGKSNPTAEELKKGYRKLSLKMHPDKGGSTEAFQNLSGNYRALRIIQIALLTHQ